MSFPYFSPFLKELGASPFIIGFINSMGYLMLIFVRIPGSHIADEYGRKQIIVVMTFGVALSTLFIIFAPDWRWVLLGVILSNLSLIYQPAMEAMTADSIPSDVRGVGFALMRVIPQVFSIASPIIAGYIVGRLDLVKGVKLIYITIFLASLAAAILRYLYLEETLENPKRLNIGGLISSYKESLSSIFEAWNSIPKNIKILTFIMLITAFEDPVFIQFASLYVLDVISIPKDQWGYAFSLLTLSSLIFAWPLGKFVDKYGRKKSILLGFLLSLPATYLFIISRNIIHLSLVLIIYGATSNLIGPAFQAFVTDHTPKELRGRVFGVIGTLNLMGEVPASILAGYLYGIEPSSPFYLLLFIDAALIIMIYLFVEE